MDASLWSNIFQSSFREKSISYIICAGVTKNTQDQYEISQNLILLDHHLFNNNSLIKASESNSKKT